jgi:hypothetical protein
MELQTKTKAKITISTKKMTEIVILISSMNMKTTSKTMRRKKKKISKKMKRMSWKKRRILMTFLIWIKMNTMRKYLKEKVSLSQESDMQKDSFKMKKRGYLIKKIILMMSFNIRLFLRNKIKTFSTIILKRN